MEIISKEINPGRFTCFFAKAGLDLRLFSVSVPRAKGDLIGVPAHVAAAIVAIICEAISTATSSVGIFILLTATLLRAPALVPSWKQMLSQTWVKLLLVWIAWMALSITWSPDRVQGLNRLGVLKFFIWIPMLWPLHKQWRWLFAGFLLSAQVLQGIQVAGAFGATHRGETLIKGLRHPTVVGEWNAMALSCWLFLAVSVGWRAMMLCIPLAILSSIGFVWAGQRGALFGILVEIIVANIVLLFAVRGWLRRVLIRLLISVIVIGGVYVVLGEGLSARIKILWVEGMKSLGFNVDGGPVQNQSNESITSEERIAMWKMSMIAWRAHPIIGVGYGGYSKATEHIDDVICPNFDIHEHDQPHSVYVMILTENGLVGLTLFLVWSGAFFVRAFQAVQLDPIRIGVFGGTVIWYAAAVGDSFHTREVFLVVGVIMMALAAMPVDKAEDINLVVRDKN